MVAFKLAFVDAAMNCVHRQWFSEVFLSPCSDFHYRITSIFNAVPFEGLKIMASQYWSLAYRDFSRFSKSFNDIMYHR